MGFDSIGVEREETAWGAIEGGSDVMAETRRQNHPSHAIIGHEQIRVSASEGRVAGCGEVGRRIEEHSLIEHDPRCSVHDRPETP